MSNKVKQLQKETVLWGKRVEKNMRWKNGEKESDIVNGIRIKIPVRERLSQFS